MSWFKRRTDSKNSLRSSDTSSLNSEGMVERRSRCDTDPETCLEVFRSHWEQAYKIISRDVNNGTKSTLDEIGAVSQNFEQMVTLLADEEGMDGQGMPGPILHFLLEHEILEKFCGWCYRSYDDSCKLIKEQLRMYDHLISHSNQLLLIHKPVIRPLLNLLASCQDEVNLAEIEPNMMLLLHQVCISISKEAMILESFFNMNADHGPTKFLIFSLLIPFIHREGTIGQQARDALLLIMALSSKYPYIGKYIAENSDFCPVLATGLSGLYSDLPRKIDIPSEDWFQITDDDVQNKQEMAMFLNSLEFCNAVVQIAHPLVRDQLIQFIYNGFLVPVMGPALHQNSREEVITATAYLDLFLRKISESSLIKAFLTFIFLEKNDEIIILDSLITRINSSSKLCLVSLSLFHTLVDLNCEDVMFDLIFKHLIPCTHVMVSQRRSVRDQDLYSKSAEKFLSLRPTCCLPEIDSPKHNMGDIPGLPKTNNSNTTSLSKFIRSRKEKNKRRQSISELRIDHDPTSFPVGSFGSKLEHFETCYLDYLHDANIRLLKCTQACHVWLYPYDGKTPPPTSLNFDAVSTETENAIEEKGAEKTDIINNSVQRESTNDVDCENEKGSNSEKQTGSINSNKNCDSRVAELGNEDDIPKGSAIDKSDDILKDLSIRMEEDCVEVNYATEEDFISMLEDSDSPVDKTINIEDSMKSLESMLSTVSARSTNLSRTSTPRKDSSQIGILDEFGETSELSTVYFDCETTQPVCDNEEYKSINETSFEMIDNYTRNKTTNATEFEILDSQQLNTLNNNELPGKSQSSNIKDVTSFVDISVSQTESNSKSINSSNIKGSDSNITKKSNSNSTENGDGDSTAKSNERRVGFQISEDGGKGDVELEVKEGTRRGSVKSDKTVRFAGATTPSQPTDSLPRPPLLGVGMSSYKQNKTPSIGPFLMALLLKLEGMIQNSLPVNLMLTGLISRLAVYSQPLLRSFLLNHNLVFQPTVKSLVQVLTSVRQKVDHYSYTVQNFEALLLRARRTLAQREGLLPERGHSLSPSPEMVHNKLRSSTVSDIPSKEKRHRTLSQLLFRRTPNEKKGLSPTPMPTSQNTKTAKLELLSGNKGMRYINRKHEDKKDHQGETLKTRNAVYCAIVLEEFVKELAALAQEHAVLHCEDVMFENVNV